MRAAPDDVRVEAGYALYRVQLGRDPMNWKPMATVGPGVAEIRVHGARPHRVFYVAKFEEAVYVLHVFEKKGRKTSGLDLQIGLARYRELIRVRALERKARGTV